MKNFITGLIIFFVWSAFGLWLYTQLNATVQTPEVSEPITAKLPTQQKEKNIQPIKDTLSPPKQSSAKNDPSSVDVTPQKQLVLVLSKKKAIDSQMPGFTIRKDTLLVMPPVGVKKFQKTVFDYLNSHQDKVLEIVGWYSPDEKVKNIGIKRAQYIKDQFVNFGLNPDRLIVEEKKYALKFLPNNSFVGGISFIVKDVSPQQLTLIDKGITHKTLYTYFNQRKFKPDNTLKSYTFELKHYLTNHPNKKVEIVGHTDNTGDEKDNFIIARDRATNVMKYLINKGIAADKLNASSKGETEPTTDNSTKALRAKNRRIEIKIY